MSFRVRDTYKRSRFSDLNRQGAVALDCHNRFAYEVGDNPTDATSKEGDGDFTEPFIARVNR